MEEIFEAIVAIAVIVFAVARKNAKKKAAKKPEKPAQTMPKDAFEVHKVDIEANSAKDAAVKAVKAAKQVVLEEILEIKDNVDDEESRPSLEHSPVHMPPPVSVPPAAAAAIPMHPGFAAIAKAGEGDCPHPDHEPMPRHEITKRPAPVRIRAVEEATAASPRTHRRFDSAAMRRAVVTAEILNRPVALRRQGGRT